MYLFSYSKKYSGEKLLRFVIYTLTQTRKEKRRKDRFRINNWKL